MQTEAVGLLLRKGYASDPQILFGAIGDATCDRAPLQIGQFGFARYGAGHGSGQKRSPGAMKVTGVKTRRITAGATELLPLLERVITELEEGSVIAITSKPQSTV